MNRILIISPHSEWTSQATAHLIQNNFEVESAMAGKEGQLKAYKNLFDYIFLDMDTTDHLAVEVLKYLKTTVPQTKVFLTASSPERLVALGTDVKYLTKTGAHKVVFGAEATALLGHIHDLGQIKKWKDIKDINGPVAEEAEAEITDGEFTRVKINEFFDDVKAVLDYYIRLGSNRYIKIIHKGEKSSGVQLKKYADSGAEWLYFLTKDRGLYVSYQNEMAKELFKKNPADGGRIIKAMKTATDKYIEEIHTQGIQPALIEEGKAICQNMYNAAMKDKSLKGLLNTFEDFSPAAFSHAFLVSFFSTVLCKSLDWVGPKSVDTLALGSLFHDIGMLQLPDTLTDLNPANMSQEQLALYHTHTELGVQVLKNVPGMHTGVLQIVSQHHEWMNGFGFPARLGGNTIYPLAKVVALADGFADFLKERGTGPREGIKDFLAFRQNYDTELTLNLIKSIMGEKK